MFWSEYDAQKVSPLCKISEAQTFTNILILLVKFIRLY